MPTHRLAAVLFADIIGYTAMMQADEAAGIAKASRLREVITRLVPQHEGELIEMRGDGALCVFGSSVEAVRCAQRIQREVRQDVPLRIGLHLGDIVQREGHIFGDAVNVASRIEAMGVAGAVLLSDSIRQQVKNKPEFELKSLGQHAFKNVAEPMEVYALAGAGAVVPPAKQLAKPVPAPGRFRRAIWPIAGVLLLMVGLFWAWKAYESPRAASLPADLQQERIAVLPFANQTGQANLNMLGSLIADWLTKGLMEMEDARVLQADNILPLLDADSFDEITNDNSQQHIRDATGAEVLIWGDYYQLGDSLVIQLRISETATQSILRAMDLRTTEDQLMAALDQLANDVISFWAVKGQERFAQNPPAYQAYQAYKNGLERYMTDPEQAETDLWRAFRLDSSFTAPLFQLLSLYGKEGKNSAMQEVLEKINARQSEFGRWEGIRHRRLQAALDRKWLLAGKLAEQQFQQDPSDLDAFRAAVSFYNHANAPALVQELYHTLDPRFLEANPNRDIDWTYSGLSFSLYQLGRHEAVDSLVQTYDFPFFPDALAVIHLKSLAQAGRWERWESALQQYLSVGVVNTSGQVTPTGQLLQLIGDDLLILGEQERLQALAGDLALWARENPDAPDHDRSLGYAFFYQEQYENAYQAWKREQPFSPMMPGWLKGTLELARLSRLTICQAKLGHAEAAQQLLEEMQGMERAHYRWPETQQYYLAQALAALGQEEAALRALSRAKTGGFPFFQPAVYSSDPFLLPLRGNPEFEALLAPRQ